MPDISIESIVGLEGDQRGRPRALLVLGTTTEKAAFTVGFSAPADSRFEPARYDIDRADIAAASALPADAIVWGAVFELAAHPALQHLHVGVQGDPIDISTVMADQPDTSKATAHAPVFYIGRADTAGAVGVLFVHGIGPHKRGETLVTIGEPIVSFIQDWLDGVKGKWIDAWSTPDKDAWIEKISTLPGMRDASPQDRALLTVLDKPSRKRSASAAAQRELAAIAPAIVIGDIAAQSSELAEAVSKDGGPARAEIALQTIDAEGRRRAAELVMAESWWTATILPPTVLELFEWTFFVVPLMLGLHAAEHVRRAALGIRHTAGLGRLTAILWTIVTFAYLLACLALAIPVEVLLAAVFVVGILPIPQVRDAVLRIQQALVGSVGQSYVLVAGPTRLAAMASRVTEDLRWLCRHCRNVVIVAHSQGAAVVHHALRKETLPQIKALFTLGSGLKQLETLRAEHRRAKILKLAWAAPAGIALIGYWVVIRYLVIPFYADLHSPALAADLHSTGALRLGLILWIGGALSLALSAADPAAPRTQLGYWIDTIRSWNIDWTDIYASRDPVPNGPLGGSLNSVEVHNFASLAADHTGYWRNTEEVVAPIAFDIARRAGLRIDELTRCDEEHLRVAAMRRRKRTRVLEAARWTTIVALGFALLNYLSQTPISGLLPLFTAKMFDRQSWLVVTPLIGPLVLTLGAYGLMLIAWTIWTRREVTALKRRATDLDIVTPTMMFYAVWYVQSVLALVYAATAPRLTALLHVLPKAMMINACTHLSQITDAPFNAPVTAENERQLIDVCRSALESIAGLTVLAAAVVFVALWALAVWRWPQVQRRG